MAGVLSVSGRLYFFNAYPLYIQGGQNGKSYTRYLLRESYREGGKAKHRTIANLSKYSLEEIAAIRLALCHKQELSRLSSESQAVSLHLPELGPICSAQRIRPRGSIPDSADARAAYALAGCCERHAGRIGQIRPLQCSTRHPSWRPLRGGDPALADRAVLLQDGKSQVGMDHYEHRSWPAWHRHMIYVFLALHFLLRLRIRFEKTPALTLPQARILVAAVLPRKTLTPAYALELRYHTRRNHIAYVSHRKRRLALLARPNKASL